MNKTQFCQIESVPESVTFNILPVMKIEKIVTTLINFEKLGIQVIHLTGCIKKLKDLPEVIAVLSKNVSIYVDNFENLPKELRKYVENAY